MKNGEGSNTSRLLLEKLGQLDQKLGHILRLHVSSLSNAEPSEEYKKEINELRGFSAYLYNLTRISKTKEEIREIAKGILPQQKKIANYVNTYIDRLKERNLLIEITLGKEEYIVRRFDYDAPSPEKQEIAKDEN